MGIVGRYFDKTGVERGFLDSGGLFTTIDFPGAVATDAQGINSNGQIVGTAGFNAPEPGALAPHFMVMIAFAAGAATAQFRDSRMHPVCPTHMRRQHRVPFAAASSSFPVSAW